MIERVILIVLDSLGVGELPDASEYGDVGTNTLGHISVAVNGLKLQVLQRLGLGNIIPVKGVPPAQHPAASYGKMNEATKGKDTMAGHWEMMGLIFEKPFPTFPHGFSQEMIQEFMEISAVPGILGNRTASGTAIIHELGEEHIRSGFPIIYTSADSVFQVAAHEDVIPIDQLYSICEKARLLCDRYHVGRVIARPFTGEVGNFTRTKNRKDYPMKPPKDTALDILKNNGLEVAGIGKIEDIFAGSGITRAIHTTDNVHGMSCMMEELKITKNGLIFVNLVDFDMVYGHRNDPRGYATALENFDSFLERFVNSLGPHDLLIITADHGCDPTNPSTDHTREFVPLLVYNREMKPVNIGIRKTFADVGASILEIFDIQHALPGTSFMKEILSNR